jgi:hypothetical protein
MPPLLPWSAQSAYGGSAVPDLDFTSATSPALIAPFEFTAEVLSLLQHAPAFIEPVPRNLKTRVKN